MPTELYADFYMPPKASQSVQKRRIQSPEHISQMYPPRITPSLEPGATVDLTYNTDWGLRAGVV